MANLPETSEHDLRVMGITPEMIRDALRATGMNVEGDIVSLVGSFLPSALNATICLLLTFFLWIVDWVLPTQEWRPR